MGTEIQSAATAQLQITVVYSSGPRHAQERAVSMAEGTRVADAVAHSQLLQGLPAADIDSLLVSVWGRKAGLHDTLRDGDRIEILRDLRVDPKVARRERFAKQGAKSAGLFARRRAGGKAGY